MASTPLIISSYDRAAELKAFDETKSGVKGLVDAGIKEVPRIFIHPPTTIPKTSMPSFNIPVIDLGSPDKESTVEMIRVAAQNLGFFQVVNHGIPVSVTDGILEGVRRFHEQDVDVKKKLYTKDPLKTVGYNSNLNLYTSSAADWRDTYFAFMAPSPPSPEELPEVCRDIQIEYSNHVMKLGGVLFRFISEALGLKPDHLINMDCDKGLTFAGHCYPACPNPELAMGGTKHTDFEFITVLVQDDIGGLQILHQNQWIDVPPTPGALVINIGDLLQMMSNDKMKSVEHRVVANEKTRYTAACFFTTSRIPSTRLYGPIKELVTDDNPPRYKETTIHDYRKYCFSSGFHVDHLRHLRL